MKRICAYALGFFLLAAACCAQAQGDGKSQKKGDLHVTFLGVSTLLFDDGETAFMTDGFFTRPSKMSFQSMAPDPKRITNALQKTGVKTLAAVIPLHSHFDHVLDSPVVAQMTGALLIGSSSTANVARGYQFPEDRIRIAKSGDIFQFGRFKITLLESAHLPIEFAKGEITHPLKAPASGADFKVGDCYTLLVEHDGHTLVVQGSAGFLPGQLKGRKAEVVYLGIGGLGNRDNVFQNSYWDELVKEVGAQRVIPIHWDDFFKSLDEPLTPNDDFNRTMAFIKKRAKAEGVEVLMPEAWKAIDPFAGSAKVEKSD